MIRKYFESKYVYNIKIVLFTLFIFFFDLGFDNLKVGSLKFDFLDARYLLFLILPIFIYDFFLIKKKKLINLIFFFLVLIISLHTLVLKYIKVIDYSFVEVTKFFLSIFYIYIIIFYRDFILKNILKFINLFLIFYFVLIFINSFLNYYNSEIICLFGCFSKNREIFKEASHLAFISPLIIIYYLNAIKIKKLNLIYKFLILFFFISILNNLSTTLLGAIIISSILILITNYKFITNKKKFILVIVFFTLLIPFDRYTVVKIDQFYDISRIMNNKHVSDVFKIIDKFKLNEIDLEGEIKKIYTPGKSKNLSIETLITNTKLAIYSLKNDYIGWGIHNYKYAHQAYISKVSTSNVEGVMWLNSQDGTNNFNKGAVEFGFIFFVPILMIIYLLFDRKISINNKLLIFPILFSQTFIRGAGFFNGGYIVFLIILISIYCSNFKGAKK